MLENACSNALQNSMSLYEKFPLPAIILDARWNVAWSNRPAKNLYPALTETKGFLAAMQEYPKGEIQKSLEQFENFTVRDFLPLQGMSISLSPIREERQLAGITALLFRTEMSPWAESPHRSGKTVSVLAGGIRQIVGENFEYMDLAAAKADMAGIGWIKPCFAQISRTQYRLLRIASNMGEYARLLGGSASLDKEMVNYFALLTENREIICEIGELSDVPVIFDVPAEDCTLALDLRKWETAFYNLLHNSLTYTRPGNQIHIMARREEDTAILMIQDYGKGIPAERLSLITLPYESCAYDAGEPGLGLGLALAKQVVELHGGTLEIASRQEEGTTVTVSLPINTFGQTLSLAQGVRPAQGNDRFSPVYVGLWDRVGGRESS